MGMQRCGHWQRWHMHAAPSVHFASTANNVFHVWRLVVSSTCYLGHLYLDGNLDAAPQCYLLFISLETNLKLYIIIEGMFKPSNCYSLVSSISLRLLHSFNFSFLATISFGPPQVLYFCWYWALSDCTVWPSSRSVTTQINCNFSGVRRHEFLNGLWFLCSFFWVKIMQLDILRRIGFTFPISVYSFGFVARRRSVLSAERGRAPPRWWSLWRTESHMTGRSYQTLWRSARTGTSPDTPLLWVHLTKCLHSIVVWQSTLFFKNITISGLKPFSNKVIF